MLLNCSIEINGLEHYVASLSTTTLRSALRRFARHHVTSLSTTTLRSALRRFARQYVASLGTTSLRSALKNLETKFQKITFFLRFKWICIKLVRKSGEFSGRAEIPFWLSDRPEKSPEFRTGPKVRPENSVGRNSGLPQNWDLSSIV